MKWRQHVEFFFFFFVHLKIKIQKILVDANTIFRGNSISSKSMDVYMKLVGNINYLFFFPFSSLVHFSS